ncbi:hypothetical protein CP973_23420 [Streptomyces albofaciens JCM 4342]|nr:hypothetical protein CP973_23420 [Streptomyces albofaciens JCM 4342]
MMTLSASASSRIRRTLISSGMRLSSSMQRRSQQTLPNSSKQHRQQQTHKPQQTHRQRQTLLSSSGSRADSNRLLPPPPTTSVATLASFAWTVAGVSKWSKAFSPSWVKDDAAGLPGPFDAGCVQGGAGGVGVGLGIAHMDSGGEVVRKCFCPLGEIATRV